MEEREAQRQATDDVAVVICTNDDQRWRDLEVAVKSVLEASPPPDDVIIVVDHNDHLLARVRERWPSVIAVPNTQASGLSGARNSGVGAAKTSLVAFLDDDAEAEPDWLEELRAGYADPAVVAVGGLVSPSWPAGGRPDWFAPEFDWVVGCSHAGMPRVEAPVRNLVGANMSFRRAALASLGGFRHDLGRVAGVPLGCEETELCVRAQLRLPGSVVLYRPTARVRHHVHPARVTWRYFLARCRAEGKSKAAVSRIVGHEAGLSAERTYITRTLPRGIVGAFEESVRRRSAGHALRIAAILAGLLATTAGYAGARARVASGARLLRSG